MEPNSYANISIKEPSEPQPIIPPSAPSGCGFMYCCPTSVAISWATPEDDGGAPITTYMLSLTPDGEPTTARLIQAPGQSELVEGLVHGVSVQATVNASNDGGETYGPECACPLIVPLAIPTAPPASAEAAPLEPGTASITWTAPEVAPEGNAYYSVMSKSSNPSDPSVGLATDIENLSCILSTLNPESEYSFTVEVINQVGRSPAVTTNTIIFPPPPPPVEETVVEPSDEIMTESSPTEPIDTTQFDAAPMAPPITEEEPLPEGYTEAPAEVPPEEAVTEAPQSTE
jgi:hypothetical protein